MQTTKASIYDFPTYYDLVFGSDTAAEMRFLEDCFARFVDGKAKRLFEPACGTGRLLFRLGQKGYEVGGIDLNDKAAVYCNDRLERYDLKGRVQVGDMSDFTVPKKFDAAFNTINSFRHLPTEAKAAAHLQCVADAVRKGGIYALGLHLTPTHGDQTDHESWSARRGQLAINTQMWPIEKNRKKRIERYGIRFDVYKPTETMRIDDVLELRSYTLKQFRQLVENSSDWEVIDYFDFAYDADKPAQLDGTTEDIVVILKKR